MSPVDGSIVVEWCMFCSVDEKKCCLLESKWKIKYDLLRN